MTTPRAIALQGVGFAPLVLALAGFAQVSRYARAPLGGGYSVHHPPGRRWTSEATARPLTEA